MQWGAVEEPFGVSEINRMRIKGAFDLINVTKQKRTHNTIFQSTNTINPSKKRYISCFEFE
jgi:hypothetical protein